MNIRERAEMGDADAQLAVGIEYLERSDDSWEDASNGYKWCLLAAEQGNAEALARVGWCCQYGVGTAHDSERALSYYGQSVEQGSPLGQLYLASFYLEISGGDSAFRLFLKSGHAGVPEAQHATAWCLSQGLGVAKDEMAAIDLWSKAAHQGYVPSMISLGELHAERASVSESDRVAAAMWYSLAEERGSNDASDALARLEPLLSVEELHKAESLAAKQEIPR